MHAIYGVLVKGGRMLQEVAYGGVINVNVGYGGEENVAGCGVERCTDIWTPYAEGAACVCQSAFCSTSRRLGLV